MTISPPERGSTAKSQVEKVDNPATFELFGKPGHFDRALAKGPKTTTWVWNLHANAHDFDSHTSDLEEVSRKIFSAHFGHLAVIFIWLSGAFFHGARFSNFSGWLADPTHVKPSAQVVWPHHLSTGLDVGGIGEPAGEVGEAGSMEEGTAQPDEDHGQMAEVSTEDLPRDLLKVARVAVEIVSVGVEVPNPGGGFGTFRESSVEMPGLTEQFKGRWIVDLFDLALRGAPTLWWADGHRVVPRGTGSRWWATPPTNRRFIGAPGTAPLGVADPGASGFQKPKPLTLTGALGPKEGTAGGSIEAESDPKPQ